jgi:ubiquinone/menaquinone biosynthesis C-methylase UbiE
LVRRDRSAQVVALDYDGTILPRTRDYLSSHGSAGQVTICRADGKRLPFREGSFDLVLCLYGLHHFRGYFEALLEIARVLKTSGTFALIDPIRRANKPPGGHHGTDVPTSDELNRMLTEAGFEVAKSLATSWRAKAVMYKGNRQGG